MKPFHKEEKDCNKKCELRCAVRRFNWMIKKSLARCDIVVNVP